MVIFIPGFVNGLWSEIVLWAANTVFQGGRSGGGDNIAFVEKSFLKIAMAITSAKKREQKANREPVITPPIMEIMIATQRDNTKHLFHSYMYARWEKWCPTNDCNFGFV